MATIIIITPSIKQYQNVVHTTKKGLINFRLPYL